MRLVGGRVHDLNSSESYIGGPSHDSSDKWFVVGPFHDFSSMRLVGRRVDDFSSMRLRVITYAGS